MRSLPAIVVAVLLGALAGCSLLDKTTDKTVVQKMPAEKFVAYLNERAVRLQGMNADVRFTARSGLVGMPMRGDLTAAQPKYFRMNGKGMEGKVDLGSNAEQFWVYMQVPTQKPMYVYASHTDFESGKAKLPGNLPFEPEWVMQALGMHIYPPNIRYNDPIINQSDRTYTLSWQSRTPSGVTVTKQVVFEADDTRNAKPQVKKHVILDAKNKPICTAEIKKVDSVAIAGSDPRTPQSITVQYPTHILLHWPAENFELDLTLQNVQVNPRLSDEQFRAFFTRPAEYPGVQAIDLARYDFR